MRCKIPLLVAALGIFALGGGVAQAQVPNLYLADTPQQEVNNILRDALGSIDATCRGVRPDGIGRFLDELGDAVREKVLKPFWNGLMEKNPLCVVVAVVLAGFLLRGGGKLFDAFAKAGQQTSAPAGQK